NPPESGGLKYNPPNGGPAGVDITDMIESMSNGFLGSNLAGIKRVGLATALKSVRHYDFLNAYVSDLENVVDMNAIRSAQVRMGVDPLGGAGVHYWSAIAERYRLDLVV